MISSSRSSRRELQTISSRVVDRARPVRPDRSNNWILFEPFKHNDRMRLSYLIDKV